MKASVLLVPLAALPLALGCQPADDTMSEGDAMAEAAMEVPTLPVTTESEEAREAFEAGMHARDMGALNEANAAFERAVAADPQLAVGYLMAANSAASTEEFTTNLARADESAAGASEAEKLLVQITRRGFEGDLDGQLAAARELTELQPDNARAWAVLAGVQAGRNEVADSRASLERALELSPGFAGAHLQAANNYLFLEPKDFEAAERHARRAIELAPEEANPYDILGDVHRAQGNLAAAAEDYTRAAERAPALGSPLQQRGHVHSFLGNYEQARADYDRAMELEMARGNNNAPFYAVFRAYVNLHAGEPEAAIEELRDLVAAADTMQMEGTADIRINALTNIVQIAIHQEDFETASSTLETLAAAMRRQAEEVGTDPFRRQQEAQIAYWEGMLAARRGDAEAARTAAQQIADLLEPDPNPRKMDPVHEVLGMADFAEGSWQSAAEHLSQAAPGNVYMDYYEGVALAEAGRADAAQAIFDELAVYNFNGVGYALVRADVLQRARSGGVEEEAA